MTLIIGFIAVVFAGVYITCKFIVYAVISHRRFLFQRQRGCQPPPKFPQSSFMMGMDLLIENIRALENGLFPLKMKERYARMGACTWTSTRAGEVSVHTIEPENIKAILSTQFHDFELPASRKTALEPVFGPGIFTHNHEAWRSSRNLLQPNFRSTRVRDLAMLEYHVHNLITRIPTDGSVVDIQNLFFMLTMDSATEFLFGHSSGTLNAVTTTERHERFAHAFTDATYQSTLDMCLPWVLAIFLRNRNHGSNIATIHDYVSEYVEKAVKMRQPGMKRSEKTVFLEELATTTQSAQKIQAELLNILLAGRDTTAGLLSYIFYMLPRNPQVLQELRLEVDQLKGRHPTYEELKKLEYLSSVIKESLRLFPVVPVNARQAVRDTTLPRAGGQDGRSPIFVKKGQVVHYQPYVMHRRQDIYGTDAEEFRPQRWAKIGPKFDTCSSSERWAYVPFNKGRRNCMGEQYALIEVSYTTVRLLQAFMVIEHEKNQSPLKVRLNLTASIQGGVNLIFREHEMENV